LETLKVSQINTIMKKFTLFLITLLFGFSGIAQVTYTYDATGNRIRREIILKSAEIPQDSAAVSQIPVIGEEPKAVDFGNPALEETFNELQVSLYPNPTQGAVYFKLNRLPEDEKPELELWGPTGTLIGKSKITGLVTRINLWEKPAGIYLVKTTLEGQPVTWKIIKE